MCRKNYLHGCCMAALGLGMLVGHCLDSWLLCSCLGLALLMFGFCAMRKK